MSRTRNGGLPLPPASCAGLSALNLPADGLLDDVIDDVGRRVVDAAGLADLGLLLNLGLVAGRQPDHLAQEPLVDGSQDFDGQDAEVIGRAVGEVQALQDRLENLVVDRQLRRDAVGVFRYVALLLEMEEAGIVLFIGLAAQVAHETGVNVGPFAQLQKLLVRFKPPVFRHAKENHAVNRPLHGGVQVIRRKALVPQGDVPGKRIPPAFDFLQKLHVHFGRAALPLGRCVLVETRRTRRLRAKTRPTIPASGRGIRRKRKC